MRLSSVSLVAVFLFATSSIFAQHSSGGGKLFREQFFGRRLAQ